MATLHIDKIIAEKVNQDDLIRLLETVIDEEMQRPEAEMNCDLIDQCVDALLEMRQDRDHLVVMVPLMQDKAFLHLIQRKAGNTARLNGAGARCADRCGDSRLHHQCKRHGRRCI